MGKNNDEKEDKQVQQNLLEVNDHKSDIKDESFAVTNTALVQHPIGKTMKHNNNIRTMKNNDIKEDHENYFIMNSNTKEEKKSAPFFISYSFAFKFILFNLYCFLLLSIVLFFIV